MTLPTQRDEHLIAREKARADYFAYLWTKYHSGPFGQLGHTEWMAARMLRGWDQWWNARIRRFAPVVRAQSGG
jgi:hypothetical protein